MKRKFTGNTRLFLCISGAIIVIALIMQIAGVGLNLGIDFTGGSILSYSVGEAYDTADVEAILASSGYTGSQITKAAPSAASIALQEKIAAEAAAAAEAVEEAADAAVETAEVAADDVAEAAEAAADDVAEAAEAADAEEPEATPEPTSVPLLNLDKSGLANDGLTDLQIRLRLVDETAGMEDAVKAAVASVVSAAKEAGNGYRTATNLEISNLGYDLTYAGGKILEFDMGADFDKEAVATAVNAALSEGGYNVENIQFVKYDPEAEQAALAAAAEQAAAEEAAAEEAAETDAAEAETADETEAETAEETEAEEAAEETGTCLRILVNLDDVTSRVRGTLEKEMTAKYPNFRFVSIDHVSAIAGRDLLSNAIKALLIAFACMLVYIAFRFSPLSGAAALFALVHDILIMCSFMVFFRGLFQVNSPFIAAILTIVGYSINNTIIIFDRIRETRAKPGYTQADMMDVVEVSVASTLSRTINTTLTTLFTLVCLYIFGVTSIKEFAFPLIVGMLAGTYSSVLLSGQVWAMWDKKLAERKAAKASAAK